LLGVATVMIAALALVLYRRSGDWGILVGVAALYYWSLYGAWYIVIDKSGGFSGKNYHYLETKMFPVQLDRNYLITLGLYSAFILLVELTALAALKGGHREQARSRLRPQLVLRHEPILILAAVAGLASWIIIRDKLNEAWALNASAYLYTRMQTGPWYSLHQVLNRIAMLPPAIAVAAIAAGRGSRGFLSLTRRYTLPAYLVILLAMGWLTFVLGNKNEVFVSLVTGVLAYFGMARKPKVFRAALVAVAGVWFLYSIDFFRGVPFSNLSQVVSEHMEEATDVGGFVTSSNEAYAAHFSMYGVLAAQVPPQFGYSLYALACSVIPRVIWPDRPLDIYYYYSQSVGVLDGQGYSLHHATGWYLNFGYPGVALGAIVLGLVWAFCLNARHRVGVRSALYYCVFAEVAPWLFAAQMAPLIRAGPEAYKGWLIESVLIPLGVLVLACRTRRRTRKLTPKLAWKPGRGWVFLAAK